MTDRPTEVQRVLTIPIGHNQLEGNLHVPPWASGIVLFAHGSGSSRHSPRNRLVARQLNDAGPLVRPLAGDHDLDPLLERIGDARYVLLGEASTERRSTTRGACVLVSV